MPHSALDDPVSPRYDAYTQKDPPSAEARDCRLELTEAGRQALECARVRWEQAQEDVRGRLGEVGVAALEAALAALEKL